jgi:putative phosphoesterase
MRIGVVCDTHNNLRSVRAIVEIFDRAGVDRVVHTGDITQAKVLDAFASMRAPLYGVWGNNDLERETLEPTAARHAMHIVDGPLQLEWHGRAIVVVHDPRDLDRHLARHHALALHGHTHLHRHERVDGTLVFNPGECAGMLPRLNRVGIVDLETLACRLVHF